MLTFKRLLAAHCFTLSNSISISVVLFITTWQHQLRIKPNIEQFRLTQTEHLPLRKKCGLSGEDDLQISQEVGRTFLCWCSLERSTVRVLPPLLEEASWKSFVVRPKLSVARTGPDRGADATFFRDFVCTDLAAIDNKCPSSENSTFVSYSR